MQVSKRTREGLLAGEIMRGTFALRDQEPVAGTLHWTFEDGARVDLIGDTSGWPTGFAPNDLTLHGRISENDDLTLLGARVQRVSASWRLEAMTSSVLALGAHVSRDTYWQRGIYGTTNLSEWVRDSGLMPEYDPNDRDAPTGMLWQAPTRHEFEVPRADAALAGYNHQAPIGYVRDWSIETGTQLVINSRRRQTLDQMYERYALPLLSFTAFVADRPDSLIREILLDPERNERIEVWRIGPRLEPQSWRPDKQYLFHSDEVPRQVSTTLRKWWAMYSQLSPALDLYGEYVNGGNLYTPARFLTLYTAMEGYCSRRRVKKDFKQMRTYAGVSDDTHGCDKKGLALLGKSRKYYAHLNELSTDEIGEIQEQTLGTTRRAAALMQACLIRELGFGPRQTERHLDEHYFNWPIPRVT